MKYRAYMCKIDFEDERGEPIEGNTFYSSEDDLREAHKCAGDCGIVEVEISFIRIVDEGTGN